MWLILCDPGDASALWAGHGLRTRGLKPIEFVSPVELACAQRIEYYAGNGSPAHASAQITGGRRLEVRRLLGTLNRAAPVDYPQVRRARPTDRAYVQAEMDAILLAWLGALPAPVFNPAHPSGWGGAQCHPFAWGLRAQSAGFATAPHRCGHAGLEVRDFGLSCHTTSHIVFRDRTYPQLPKDLELASARLAECTGIPLLGITLAWLADGRPQLLAATPMPDLHRGGEAFLNALATAFTEQ